MIRCTALNIAFFLSFVFFKNVVDGNWTDWKAWEKCPVTCGGGIQSRRRTCSNPPPSNGGKDCEGSGVATRSCNELPCPGM